MLGFRSNLVNCDEITFPLGKTDNWNAQEPWASATTPRLSAIISSIGNADPRDIYERALAFLQADYFQHPDRFSDRLLTVLPTDSALAGALCDRGGCILAFEQGWRRYSLPCSVREARNGSAAREAAIWHNRLFNPALPDTVHVLDFHPDWASAVADPWPGGRKSHSP
jgi:hypothetical protein